MSYTIFGHFSHQDRCIDHLAIVCVHAFMVALRLHGHHSADPPVYGWIQMWQGAHVVHCPWFDLVHNAGYNHSAITCGFTWIPILLHHGSINCDRAGSEHPSALELC